MDFRICVGNLGKYNEDELVFEWVDLPCDKEEFDKVLARIGISDEPDEFGRYYEEWHIQDTDLAYEVFKYSEYPGWDKVEEWSDIVAEILDHDDDDIEKVGAALEVGAICADGFVDALDEVDEWFVIDECHTTDNRIGVWYVCDVLGGPEDLDDETLNMYFDYEMYGQDCLLDYDDTLDMLGLSGDDPVPSDYRIGCDLVERVFGDIEFVDRNTKERYFDYKTFGRDLHQDFHFVPYGSETLAIPA